MSSASAPRTRAAIESIGLALFVVAYAVVFRTVVPSGDGLVYVRAIEEGALHWNPNHLLMEPAAFLWHGMLARIGLTQSPLVSLKMLSGFSAVVTVLLFAAVVRRVAGVSPRWRIAACLGLFFSSNFLSLTVSEEHFMVQMPWLLAALWIGVKQYSGERSRPDRALWAGVWGVVLAISVLFQANNAFLAVSLMLFLATRPSITPRSRVVGPLVMAASGVAVGLPVLLGAHRLSGSTQGLLSWLVSYQGAADGAAGQLYGIEPTASAVLESAARLAYNLLANFANPAGVGTVAKSLVFAQPMEYQPNYLNFVVGSVLLVVTAYLLVSLASRWLRYRTVSRVGSRLGLFWIAAYATFNLLWNDSSDQFYVQLLPVFWLWLVSPPLAEDRSQVRVFRLALACSVPLLAIFNTLYVVAPNTFTDQDGLRARHVALLRPGDLEIVPGWDHIRWLSVEAEAGRIDQLNLMTMALRAPTDDLHIEQLTGIVRSHLQQDRRVFVARLYDKDDVARPWDQLRKTGWPRERIQALLAEFDVGDPLPIGRIAIRPIRLRKAASPSP